MKPQTTKRNRFSPSGLIDAAAFVLLLVMAVGFLGRLHWLPELAAHFRVQYLALAAGFTLWFALRARRGASFLFAACTGYHLWLIAPFLISAPEIEPGAARPVKLLIANVNSSNPDTAPFLKRITDEEPDLVLVIEVSPHWVDALEALRADYPHQVLSARRDNFGIALISRSPLQGPRIVTFGDADIPSVLTGVDVGGETVTFVGTHPLPPVGLHHARLRNDQLNTIAAFAALEEGPLIVAGDLNATPWSPVFRDFLDRSGLINSAEGRGVFGSWPTFLPPMAIPIDHLLHSGEIQIVDRTSGPAIGSDHLPQTVTFTVR